MLVDITDRNSHGGGNRVSDVTVRFTHGSNVVAGVNNKKSLELPTQHKLSEGIYLLVSLRNMFFKCLTARRHGSPFWRSIVMLLIVCLSSLVL
jgi:hypothetical protein